MVDFTGNWLGPYQIVAEIGRGGMSVVYKAYQPSLSRYVAIKVLSEHLSQDTELVQRFQREARAAAMLQHPNIIHINDVGQAGNLYYIVMDYVSGPSLAARLKREGTLSLQTALSILRQIGAALDYAHSQGIVHRDVKPSNILLTPGGQAILSDLGIAKAPTESSLTRTGTIIGTPEYMSPEQAQGERLDGRSDLYSLGLVLYEMLSGQVPFHADSPVAVLYKQVHEPPPAPSVINSAISPAVERVLLRALDKDKHRRYGSAGEMAAALAQAAVHPWAEAAPTVRTGNPAPLPAPPTAQPVGRRKVPFLYVSLVLLVGLVLLGISLSQGHGPSPPAPTNTPWVITATPGRPTREPAVTAAVSLATTALPPTRVPPHTPLPPPTNTPVPSPTKAPPPTPSKAERERDLISYTRLRLGNGEVIFAYQADQPPSIDGILSEWTGKMHAIQHVVHLPANWWGAADLSGAFYVTWDQSYLYLGVQVTDDLHVQTEQGEGIYNGDDVELQYDANLQGDFNATNRDGDDGQIGFSPGDFANLPPEAYVWLPTQRNGTMTNLAARQTGEGYVIEAAVPWWVFELSPHSEMALGFCLNVSDNDSPGTAQQQCMVSTSPSRKWGDPTTWGTLVLVDWR